MSTRARGFRVWRRLEDLGGTREGNLVTLFDDGARAFPAMWDAIEAAQERVWVETYILALDEVGARFVEQLEAAAARGVDVILLYDAVGSFGFDEDKLAGLTSAGGKVSVFNPVFGPRFLSRLERAPLWVRDHRKILVVDDEIGFVGGMNLTADYADAPIGTGRFRDTHASVRGPAVDLLAQVFAESYVEARQVRLPPGRPIAPREGGARVQVLGSNTRRRRRQIQASVRRALKAAQKRAWLTSPYFVPPARLVRALTAAAARGVSVRVLTAGISDVPIVRRASHHLYERLLRKGVELYELENKTLHAKTWIVDDEYAQVGSFNLDAWSYRRNLEVSLGLFAPEHTEPLVREFEGDLADATRVDLDRWKKRGLVQRVVDWCAYLLLRW